jgi:hypothetical protein
MGTIIHAVDYSSSWFGNEVKKEGGWTLEMIDTHHPCSGSDNWKGADASGGGTPGSSNSVDAVVADQGAPQLTKAFLNDNQSIVLVFDEPLDSLSSAVVSNYHITGGLLIAEVTTLSPLYNQVRLKVTTPLPCLKTQFIR